MRNLIVAALAALALAAAAPAATAAPLLCNTGQAVGCSSVLPLVYGTPDPNYTMISGPATNPLPAPAWVVVGNPTDGYPLSPGGPWVADDSTSEWIGPPGANTESDGVLGGVYDYRTTFDLTGYNPLTTAVSGLWATDDNGVIFINGLPTVNTSLGFTSLTPFTITSGFVAGINVIDFSVVNSGGGPTGLRVEDAAVTATPVPEPATLLLLGSGLAATVRARRRAR